MMGMNVYCNTLFFIFPILFSLFPHFLVWKLTWTRVSGNALEISDVEEETVLLAHVINVSKIQRRIQIKLVLHLLSNVESKKYFLLQPLR